MSVIRNFLKQDNIQSLLEHEDMDEIFYLWAIKGNRYEPLTTFFENIGINPLEYLTLIPNAFYCEENNITCIVIPHGIKTINSNAIFHCTGLEEVHIPNTVTEIFENAISMCSNLKKVIYEGTIEEFEKICDERFCTEDIQIVCEDRIMDYEYTW